MSATMNASRLAFVLQIVRPFLKLSANSMRGERERARAWSAAWVLRTALRGCRSMRGMPPLVLCFSLSAGGVTAQSNEPAANPVVFGRVTDKDGKPAKRIRLTAWRVDIPVINFSSFRSVITDQEGRYRFEDLPGSEYGDFAQDREYLVFATDLEAGYSYISQYPEYRAHPPVVCVSAQHPQAEFNFRLPPKSGFLRFRAINRANGAPIRGATIDVFFAGEPRKGVLWGDQSSDKPILVPPNCDLLIHVKSQGYKESYVSARRGKPIRFTPGERMSIDFLLEPNPA